MIREAIIAALKSQGVAQRRCALDCGIDPTTLNNFLKNRRGLPVENVEKVLNYLKLDIMETKKFLATSGSSDWRKTGNNMNKLIGECPDAVCHINDNINGEYITSFQNGHEYNASV